MKASFLFLLCLSLGIVFGDEIDYSDLDLPAHDYWKRDLHDPFTRIKSRLESGEMDFNYGSEKDFVVSLLKELKIPKTSQMLVFSATSLQTGLISTSNPRALYFNEDLYLGWVPGGKIEIVSIDPALGGIFYIFEFKGTDKSTFIVERISVSLLPEVEFEEAEFLWRIHGAFEFHRKDAAALFAEPALHG